MVNKDSQYKLLSLTYKVLTIPANLTTYMYVHNLISVQSTCRTHKLQTSQGKGKV